MNNIFVVAGIISIVFLIAKFIEMRFIEKESNMCGMQNNFSIMITK